MNTIQELVVFLTDIGPKAANSIAYLSFRNSVENNTAPEFTRIESGAVMRRNADDILVVYSEKVGWMTVDNSRVYYINEGPRCDFSKAIYVEYRYRIIVLVGFTEKDERGGREVPPL